MGPSPGPKRGHPRCIRKVALCHFFLPSCVMLRGLRQDFRIRRVLHENNINRESVMGTQVVKDLLIDFGAEEGEEPSVDLLAAHRFLKALFSALHVKLSDKDITFVIERCKSKSAADQEIFSLDDFLAFLKFSLPQCEISSFKYIV